MSIEKYFTGKKVLVTGVGQGIGRAIAVRLCQYGAVVYGISKSEERLKSLKEEFPQMNLIQVDLSNWNETKEALEDLERMDCLVNNAAILQAQEFLDVTPETFDALYAVNVKGVINVSQLIAKKMKEGNGGSIVNISTCASKKAIPLLSVYCSTKAALDSIGRSMALELGKYKIRVNMINNCGIDTKMFRTYATSLGEHYENQGLPGLDYAEFLKRYPMGKMMLDMDEMVNLTLFVLSDAASMVTGQTHVIDGGYSLT